MASSGSPIRVDRFPLGEIHSLVRSPVSQSDRHRCNEMIHDDENNYGNIINPTVTPKKRRLENKAPLSENNEADWSIEKKVRTPQKLRHQTTEICAGNSSPMKTPITSPEAKVRSISTYRRPVDDDLPKSSSKKRKDHNLLEETNSNERNNEVLVKMGSLEGHQCPTGQILYKDSNCDQVATVEDSRKFCAIVAAKADVTAADETRVWAGMADGADDTGYKKSKNRQQDVMLDNSLSRAFVNQRLESMKAVISIDEMCRHLENLQSTYGDKDLKGLSVDSGSASNDSCCGSKGVQIYAEIVGRVGSNRIDSSGYLKQNESIHVTESTITQDEQQGSTMITLKRPVVNIIAPLVPVTDFIISKNFPVPSHQNLLTAKSSDRVDEASISEFPSQRQFAAALHNGEAVSIPGAGATYNYIGRDIERMRENIEMQVMSTTVHARQELSSSSSISFLGRLDKDISNSSRRMRAEDESSRLFLPNSLNVIDISVATAQHRKQQEIRGANQSTKYEDHMHQRHGVIHTNPIPSCVSSSSGNIAATVSSFAPSPVSAPIEPPLAPVSSTIPSRDENARKRSGSQPAAAHMADQKPANMPAQVSPSPHNLEGSESRKMEDSEKIGECETESEEDRQYTSFHEAVAAARESSISVLFRGKRGSLRQHQSSVQQTAVAFHMTEVDFLSCSTVLRRGEVLSPLGIQGPSPTVISTPIHAGNGNREDLDSIMRRDELAVSNTVLTTLSDTASFSQSHYLSARVPLSDLSAYQSKLQSWRDKYRVVSATQSPKDFNSYSFLSPHSAPSSSVPTCSSLRQKISAVDRTTGKSSLLESVQNCFGGLPTSCCDDFQCMYTSDGDGEVEDVAGLQTARGSGVKRDICRNAVESVKVS